MGKQAKWLQQELDRRFKAVQLQMDQRFTASEKAVIVAQKANEKRLDNVNEFRQTLSDQNAAFVTQDRYDGLAHQVDLMQGQIIGNREAIATRLSQTDVTQNAEYYKSAGTRAQLSLVIAAFAAIIALAAVITTIIVATHG